MHTTTLHLVLAVQQAVPELNECVEQLLLCTYSSVVAWSSSLSAQMIWKLDVSEDSLR